MTRSPGHLKRERTSLARPAAALLACLFACSTSVPKATEPPGPTGSAPLIDAPCSPGAPPSLSAHHISFDKKCLSVSSGRPFALPFANRDRGVNHNVQILVGPRGYSTTPPALFRGDIFPGVRTVNYQVGGLPAGLLQFECVVHHDQMYGFFGVAPRVARTNAGIQVVWSAPGRTPKGYVFDVFVKRPGADNFAAWKTGATTMEETLAVTDPGTYAFRITIYPADHSTPPLGFSPISTVTVS